MAPELAVGDGALGFWRALEEAFPSVRQQRCPLRPAGYVPFGDRIEALNILNKLLKSPQADARRDLREIWLAPDRVTAEAQGSRLA